MEMIHSKELGLTVLTQTRTVMADSFSLTDAMALYHRLRSFGKTKLFFESSGRSMRNLTDFLGHDDLVAIEISDTGRFRDYLFDRGMSSSLVKRVFSSARADINLAIRKQGLPINNLFSRENGAARNDIKLSDLRKAERARPSPPALCG